MCESSQKGRKNVGGRAGERVNKTMQVERIAGGMMGYGGEHDVSRWGEGDTTHEERKQ